MKRPVAILSTILLSTVLRTSVGSAQTPAATTDAQAVPRRTFTFTVQNPNSSSVATVPTNLVNQGCPVSVRAQQRGSGMLLNARDHDRLSDQNRPFQRLRLFLGDANNASEFRSAKVTVVGTSGRVHVVSVPAQLVNPAESESREISRLPEKHYVTKSFEVTFGRDGLESAFADLILSGYTSVGSVTLDSLTFADGSVWTPEAGKSCRIAPDPLVLISGF